MTAWEFEHLWTGAGEVRSGVTVEAVDGVITAIGDAGAFAGAQRVAGLAVPGFGNAHSHAFHRALRSRTHSGGGTFWTWREQMYAAADSLDPDGYFALARLVFAEMAQAGITSVGEFHYLHHQPGGRRYDDQNAMAMALVAAAGEAGVRLTLLDTCYLESAPGEPLGGVQLRFGDGTAAAWIDRVTDLHERCAGLLDVRIGAAVHSVRAVPPAAISAVAEWSRAHEAPLHAHVSEQVGENTACLAAYGVTPVQLLADCGALGPMTTVVHATQLTDGDVALLGSTGTGVCLCPTTERDLADGLPRARDLVDAGAPLSVGTDSQAVIDLLEEVRAVEHHERLRTHRRGHFTAAELLTAAAVEGQRALGWAAAGIAVGAPADFVAIRLDSVRTAGGAATLENAAFAASAEDIHHVVAGGRTVVQDGRHVAMPDLGRELQRLLDGSTR